MSISLCCSALQSALCCSKRKARDLDDLCQKRNLSYEQSRFKNIQSAWDEIDANKYLSSDDDELPCPRPFGVPSELGYAAFDIWEHIILEHVPETSEIKKLRGVCRMFQAILRNKYVQMMLPQIVMLVRRRRYDYLLERPGIKDNVCGNGITKQEDNEAESEDVVVDEEVVGNDEEDDDEIFRLDPILRKLRLVSKQCKESIEDIFLLNHLNCEGPRPYLKLSTPADLKRISTIVDSSSFDKNKFFPGCVELCEDDLDGVILFPQEAVSNFLRHVGKRITSFKYRSFHNTELIYNRLRNWVEEMPNLEVLELSGMFGNDVFIPRLEEIQEFPCCSSLQCYHEGLLSLPAPFVQRILMANPHIGNIRVCETDSVIKLLPQGIEFLRNVTSLECLPHYFLLRRQNLPWNLNKLVFDGVFISDIPFPSRDIFPFLNQFKETLEHLEIMVTVIDWGNTLHLPQVKTFKWKHHDSFRNLNFILNMDHLEDFQVKVREDFMTGARLSMKYEKIIGNESKNFMGRSIWEVFPYLERILLRSSTNDAVEYVELRRIMHLKRQ